MGEYMELKNKTHLIEEQIEEEQIKEKPKVNRFDGMFSDEYMKWNGRLASMGRNRGNYGRR